MYIYVQFVSLVLREQHQGPYTIHASDCAASVDYVNYAVYSGKPRLLDTVV